MAMEREPVRVAINVMRARLTVLGFNLAVITFQISNVANMSGGISVAGIEKTVHLSAGVALLIGAAVSVLAIVLFIVSSAFDREGVCDHWVLLSGELAMYLALAQSVTGFFAPYLHVLLDASMPQGSEQDALVAMRGAMAIVGGLAWAFAHYVGPAVTLLRSPYGRRVTLTHAVGFVVGLLFLSWIWSLALQVERPEETRLGPILLPLSGLFAPLVW